MDDLRCIPTKPGIGKLSARAAIAPFRAMEVMREAGRRQAAGERLIRFDVGQPHLGAPEKAIAAAERALREDKLGYTDALGSNALREAIAAFYARRYGVTVDPRRVAITTGASGAFLLAFLALFDTGDRIALAAPSYPPYRHILTSLGMAPVNLPARAEDKFQLTPALIEAERDLAGVLIANPANPTGAMLSGAELAALAQTAIERGLPLISDEIYHGLTFAAPAETMLAADPDAIVINSFSKYWAMTGWRVGWLIAPDYLMAPLERLAQNLAICPPAPAQAAALAALDALDECEARRLLYARNREILLEALPAIGLPPATPPDGAFYMMLDVSRFGESASFCTRAMNEAGVCLTAGHDFDETRGALWARLAYPITEAETREGVERLTRFTRTLAPR
ncbi:MAG: aminotransferase class I/II-fold pyridoxal phosphate-dependent enzyme [Pseudomonadota bacterium]